MKSNKKNTEAKPEGRRRTVDDRKAGRAKKKPEKKRGAVRLLTVFLILCAVMAAAVFGINAYVLSIGEKSIISRDEAAKVEGADCILVLGAGVREDGTPSHMLEDRLLEAIELYKLGAAGKLLMSGDHGQADYDEVNTMKSFAIKAGVPSEDIFMDHAGFSTYDSVYRAKEIFGCKKIIVVTQKYHLYRALYLAQSFGLEAYGVNSDPRSYSGQEMREIREIVARDKDFFSSIFKPKPKFLGESIQISGDGNVTNDDKEV